MFQSQLFISGDPMSSTKSNDDFAQFLKREMYNRGINQTTLARLSGLTPGAISNIIRGKRARPDSETCHKLAVGLGKVGWQGDVKDLLRMAGHMDALVAVGDEADYMTIKEIMEEYNSDEKRELLIEFARLLLRRQ